MLDLIKRLCEVNGISGREDKVRQLIIKEVEPFADEITVDPLGNLCVLKKGVSRAKNRVMLDAHMDEVGFIITSVTSDGNLRFECVGGISSAVMLGRHVFVGENKIPGVIGVTPVHLLATDKKTQFPDKSSLVIDIGASSADEAKKIVGVGDYACFDSEFCLHLGSDVFGGRSVVEGELRIVVLDQRETTFAAYSLDGRLEFREDRSHEFLLHLGEILLSLLLELLNFLLLVGEFAGLAVFDGLELVGFHIVELVVETFHLFSEAGIFIFIFLGSVGEFGLGLRGLRHCLNDSVGVYKTDFHCLRRSAEHGQGDCHCEQNFL